MSERTEKLVVEYYREKKVADADLDGHDPNTYPSAKMRQQDAAAACAQLRAEYADYVRQSAISILVSGPPARVREFTGIAAAECRAIVVDAGEFYAELARDIEPALGDRREFGGTHLGQLVRALTEVGKEMDVWQIGSPQIEDLVQVPDPEALVGYIRALVRKCDGDRLCARRLGRDAAAQALAIKYTAGVVAVVVCGGDPDELRSIGKLLFTGESYEVSLPADGASVEQAAVVAALAEIRKKVKDGRAKRS